MRIKLGDRVKDKISGFKGIVVCRSEWLNGCVRITIQPEACKSGNPLDAQTYDEHQIERLQETAIAPARVATGGPSIKPTRNREPRR